MIWPAAVDDVDPDALLLGDERPPHADRPWVLANMIATVDGAATDSAGRSGGLGGAADRRLFRATRAVADVIVAGAATVLVEDYGPPRTPTAVQRRRRADGRSARPRLAVVSGSLALDPASRLFSDPSARPLVLTCRHPDPARRAALTEVADIVEVDAGVPGALDWRLALAELRREGHAVALVEGGPLSNGQLLADDLVDEVCLTLSPVVVGGDASRIARGPTPGVLRPLRLDRVLEEDGFLFLRYLRDRTRG
ncbi:MAG: pyrimidine reductase family protein [Acidimicrobiia bacterium]